MSVSSFTITPNAMSLCTDFDRMTSLCGLTAAPKGDGSGTIYTLLSLKDDEFTADCMPAERLKRLMKLSLKHLSLSIYNDLIRLSSFRTLSRHMITGVAPSDLRDEKLLRSIAKASYVGQGLARIFPMGKMMKDKYWPEVYIPGHPSGAEMQDFFDAWKTGKSKETFDDWFSKIPARVRPHSVRYLNESERSSYEIGFCDGHLLQNGVPLFTDRIETDKSSGAAIYVLTPENKMYVGPYLLNEFQHSSFYSGRPIIGAGEIITNKDGKVTFLSNRSGHYQPGERQMLDVLAFLKEKNVDLTDVELDENTPTSITRHTSAENFFEMRTPSPCKSPSLAFPSPVIGDIGLVLHSPSPYSPIRFDLMTPRNGLIPSEAHTLKASCDDLEKDATYKSSSKNKKPLKK